MRRDFWVADGNADKRVGTAIIEEPLALMPDEAFRKDRSGSILSALFEVGNGAEERLVESVNELKRVVLAEKHLPGCICAGCIARISVATTRILSIIYKYYAVLRDDRRRPTFRKATVEEAFSGPCQIEEFRVTIHDGCPRNEVVAGCSADP